MRYVRMWYIIRHTKTKIIARVHTAHGTRHACRLFFWDVSIRNSLRSNNSIVRGIQFIIFSEVYFRFVNQPLQYHFVALLFSRFLFRQPKIKAVQQQHLWPKQQSTRMYSKYGTVRIVLVYGTRCTSYVHIIRYRSRIQCQACIIRAKRVSNCYMQEKKN